MHLVFVYGTLKEGFPNFYINKGTRMAGDFYTRHPYALYVVGERYVPWLVVDGDQEHRIRGQVFVVDDEVLCDLDKLEATDRPDGYQRVSLPIVSADPQQEIMADVYIKTAQQFNSANVKLGPFKEYTLEHASLYMRLTSYG